MRMARVLGKVTMSRLHASMKPGSYLLAEALDSTALKGVTGDRDSGVRRKTAMPESLVVFDRFGASPGQLIAVSEGGEAATAFHPEKVPLDAYCAAILDQIELS